MHNKSDVNMNQDESDITPIITNHINSQGQSQKFDLGWAPFDLKF